ncbi:hypothetical protein EBY67_05390, partial [bacterium]|nr:hypothetical protein [bacterium]
MYLEYSSTNVTQTLGLVKDKNKKSLKELLNSRGQPKWGDLSDKSPPGHNDLKALYVNEPGTYSLIFRSTKKQAQDFQDWVYEDVLTALRRHGSYKIGDQANALRTWLDGDFQIVLKKRDDELQLALRKRDDALQLAAVARDNELQLVLKTRDSELQLALKAHDEAHMAQLEVSLGHRDDRMLSRLAQQCEQLSVCVVFAMQRSVATALQPLLLSLQPLGELLGSLKGLTSSVSMSVRGAVKDVIDAAVTS